MLRNDGDIFLQHPDETSRRILHRGTIIEIGEEKSYIAQFEEQDLGIAADLDFLLYYELRQKFVEQGGRIVEVIAAEEGTEEDAVAAAQEQRVRVRHDQRPSARGKPRVLPSLHGSGEYYR